MKKSLVECIEANEWPQGVITNEEYIDTLYEVRRKKKMWEDAEKAIRKVMIERYNAGTLSNTKTKGTNFTITKKDNEKFLEQAFIEAIKTDEHFAGLKDLIIEKTVESIDFDKLEAKITLGEIDGDDLNKFNEVKEPTLTLNTKLIPKTIQAE